MNTILVIIINFNTYQDTIFYVNSLMYQKYVIVKIIIIDNSSTNNSYEILSKEYMNNEKVSVHRTYSNLGYGGGLKFGLSLIDVNKYDYIVFSNNDLFMKNEYLFFSLIGEYNNTINPGLIAPIMVTNGKISKLSYWSENSFFEEILSSFWLYRFYKTKRRKILQKTTPVDCISGCFMFGSTSVVKNINLFDDNTFLFGEERRINQKIKIIGKQNYIIPRLKYDHYHGVTIDKSYNYKNKLKMYIESILNYYKEYKNISKVKLTFLYYMKKYHLLEAMVCHYIIFILNKVIIFLRKLYKWKSWFISLIPFKICSVIFKKKKYYLFGNSNNTFSDNSKYLFLEFIKLSKYKKHSFWVTESIKVYKDLKKRSLPVIKKGSINCLLISVQAKYYFITGHLHDVYWHISPETKLFQLWHGTPIKKIGYGTLRDRNDIELRNKICNDLTYDRYDYLLVNSQKYVEIFMCAFKIAKSKIVISENPRNIIFENNCSLKKKKLINILGLGSFNRIILFAPTFRDDNRRNFQVVHSLLNEDARDWLKRNNFCCLLRLHPLALIPNKKNIFNEENSHSNVINVTFYEDFQELLLISDCVITDYSSLIFDFRITKKPIFYFIPDYYEYETLRNGFFRTINEMFEYGRKIEKIDEIQFEDNVNEVISYKASIQPILECLNNDE